MFLKKKNKKKSSFKINNEIAIQDRKNLKYFNDYIGHCRGHKTITVLFEFKGWKRENQRLLNLNFSFR